ncbi:hypothetical protein, unlikely [Trypanosoma brucei gambiense DAL972]|uniref:Uncharacterized protein n=1 Tax=Trypanosoma brucei gambiense (strain MHOM/CI/86/DAL972) TaxID=679716 RepID=C9ZNR5_TRYB9|nr:hypothetical protein, unlikely [Trypanosoma brucei gambiense DAL972]CBH11043.1 hypothetical protein, unlikely [Trypanosoma brucei gambiense DAL972]|eukprot:XP_011773330.1 hypothetical protein, unlikely [Trypanosoma brucei gambiense DAL972]
MVKVQRYKDEARELSSTISPPPTPSKPISLVSFFLPPSTITARMTRRKPNDTLRFRHYNDDDGTIPRQLPQVKGALGLYGKITQNVNRNQEDKNNHNPFCFHSFSIHAFSLEGR